MRLGRWIRVAIVLIVLGWVGYTVAGVGWSYFSVQELVEKTLRDASDRHRAAFAAGTQIAVDTLTITVRSAILLAALHEGILMREADVRVSANSAGLSATARWSYPVVRYAGDDILVVPMWVQRTIVIPP